MNPPSNEHKRDVLQSRFDFSLPRLRYYDLPVRNYYGEVYNVRKRFLFPFSVAVKLLIRVQIIRKMEKGYVMKIELIKKLTIKIINHAGFRKRRKKYSTITDHQKRKKRKKNWKIHYRFRIIPFIGL